MNRRALLLQSALLPLLASCGPLGKKKKLRYRLKAYVTVDGKEHTGSTVLETVWTNPGFLKGVDMGGTWMARTWGDGIVVVLGAHTLLFGLLNSPSGVASPGFRTLGPEQLLFDLIPRKGDYGKRFESGEVFDDMADARGEFAVPKRYWPVFVCFPDIRDRRSALLLGSDVASGEPPDIEVKRVTLSVTSDPISWGIRKWIPWWDDPEFKKRDMWGSPGPLWQQLAPNNFEVRGG